MTLSKPALPSVSPGQPITAQGWNAIVSAVGQLFDGVNLFGTETLAVNVLDGTTPVAGAVVVALPAAGAPVVAVPAIGSTTTYMLTNLTPGNWTVVAAAPGYATSSAAAVVPSTNILVLPLTASGTAMPSLLGLTTVDALAALAGQSIALDTILDIFGGDVSKTAPAADRTGSKVLVQYPAPGAPIVPATAAVRLVVSASPNTKDTVKENKDTTDKQKESSKDIKDVGESKQLKDAKDKVDKPASKDNKDQKDISEKLEKNLTKENKDQFEKFQEKFATADQFVAPIGRVPNVGNVGTIGGGIIGGGIVGGLSVQERRVFIPTESRPSVGEQALKEPKDR